MENGLYWSNRWKTGKQSQKEQDFGVSKNGHISCKEPGGQMPCHSFCSDILALEIYK